MNTDKTFEEEKKDTTEIQFTLSPKSTHWRDKMPAHPLREVSREALDFDTTEANDITSTRIVCKK